MFKKVAGMASAIVAAALAVLPAHAQLCGFPFVFPFTSTAFSSFTFSSTFTTTGFGFFSPFFSPFCFGGFSPFFSPFCW